MVSTPRATSDVYDLLVETASDPELRSSLAAVDSNAAGADVLKNYSDLHEDVCRIAQLLERLSDSSLTRGHRVAVLMRNSVHVMELHFAAAALHLAIVNLSPQMRPYELAYALEQSKPSILVVDVSCRVVVLETLAGTDVAANAGLVSVLWVDPDSRDACDPVTSVQLRQARWSDAFARTREGALAIRWVEAHRRRMREGVETSRW